MRIQTAVLIVTVAAISNTSPSQVACVDKKNTCTGTCGGGVTVCDNGWGNGTGHRVATAKVVSAMCTVWATTATAPCSGPLPQGWVFIGCALGSGQCCAGDPNDTGFYFGGNIIDYESVVPCVLNPEEV